MPARDWNIQSFLFGLSKENVIFSFQPVSVILVATIHLATHLKWLTRPHVPADTLYPAPIGQNVSLCPLIGRWLLFWHKFQVTRALCQCSHLRTLSHCLQNKKTGMKIWVKVGMIKPKRGCLFYCQAQAQVRLSLRLSQALSGSYSVTLTLWPEPGAKIKFGLPPPPTTTTHPPTQ